MKYVPIIGLEIHVQPNTQSKMFCACSADIFGAEPNTHTCPVCLGLPGALPVPNKRAVEATIQLGLALNSTIARESKFDRKNYFYPDLPKGYQISQYDQPIATGGHLTVTDFENGEDVTVDFTRVHLEEDTGKLVHSKDDSTLVDFNRSGMPLIEIVTEPVIRSASTMKSFLKQLRLILRYAGISDADMEKGTMRIEPNISVVALDDTEEVSLDNLPNYKVELKNINSFRFAERATDYEIQRQISILEKGETPVQETRGWDENKNITVSQRVKEEAQDYRYFPEPDIPPFIISDEWKDELGKVIPKLPAEYAEELSAIGLSSEDVDTVLNNFELLVFVGELLKIQSLPETRKKEFVVQAINTPSALDSSADNFVRKILDKEASQISDESELNGVIEKILQENPNEVARYKEGKQELVSFFMGKIMAETKGSADPKVASQLLRKTLSN